MMCNNSGSGTLHDGDVVLARAGLMRTFLLQRSTYGGDRPQDSSLRSSRQEMLAVCSGARDALGCYYHNPIAFTT
jgi:hypothetical protein